ncbi:MAG TPA: helix-turn-helix transcriptional regulator [Gemmatimonadaceae bacterium]|nr:helix-turn-helix transcriptional regulator [Gemmatimonadaceae bacterium]
MRSHDAHTQLPLTPAVLHILLALADGERHGYGIAQDVETMSGGDVRMGPGTLYGTIQRMLRAALIEEATLRRRAADDDERRRYYRITSFGRRVLDLELQRLGRLVRAAQDKRLLRGPGIA